MSGDSKRPAGGMTAWRSKFAYAFAGTLWAFRTQKSFWVHLPIAIIVFAVAALLQVGRLEWIALVLATMVVLAAELFNTAVEELVKALHPDHHPGIGRALDVAAAAVLMTAIGAVVVGLLVLGPALWNRLMPLM